MAVFDAFAGMGGSSQVDTDLLERQTNNLEQICNNIARVRSKISMCLEDIKTRWTGNADIVDINEHMSEDLSNTGALVSNIYSYCNTLRYLKEKYLAEANNGGE